MIESDTELRSIMEEPPGGFNHGRKRPEGVNAVEHERALTLDTGEQQRVDFLRQPGWVAENATAHRGVLHPDELVDMQVLVAELEWHLGFRLPDVDEAYAAGRPRARVLELRAKIDARLLEISEAGGNMTELARAFGWPIHNGSSKTMERALERARSAR